MADEQTGGADVPALDPKEKAKAERDAIVAPLKAEYGELGVFQTRFGLLVVKTPPYETFARFQNRYGADGVDQASEIVELVMSCVVYPDQPAARALLKKQPWALQKASARIRELGGSEIEDLGKD